MYIWLEENFFPNIDFNFWLLFGIEAKKVPSNEEISLNNGNDMNSLRPKKYMMMLTLA